MNNEQQGNTIYKEFISSIEFGKRNDHEHHHILMIYWHLLSVMSEDELTKRLMSAYSLYKTYKKQWKVLFHKSIRQIDFFPTMRRQHDSISGHLDMALWNTLHLDSDGILYKHMEWAFEQLGRQIQSSNQKNIK